MERVDWENEISNRKKDYEKGIRRNIDERYVLRNDPIYLKCRAEWKRFVKGEISSDELGRNLEESTNRPEVQIAKDIFDAEIF